MVLTSSLVTTAKVARCQASLKLHFDTSHIDEKPMKYTTTVCYKISYCYTWQQPKQSLYFAQDTQIACANTKCTQIELYKCVLIYSWQIHKIVINNPEH